MAAATLQSSSVNATSMSFNALSIAIVRSGSPSSSSSGNSYSSRLGRLTFSRGETAPPIELPTPTLWVHTSRGVVPHLTRDHVLESDAIRGVHVPFESYLESNPPVPVLYAQSKPNIRGPLHEFHGYDLTRHILSLGLRDPIDSQILGSNGNNFIIAQCVRGYKQVVPQSFHEWAVALHPDILFAAPDIPYTPAPYSQKRLTKSNERTLRWLTDLVKVLNTQPGHAHSTASSAPNHEPAIFAHLLGAAVPAARQAFAESLLDPLIGSDASALPHLSHVDEAVAGYVLDLVPIRLALAGGVDPSAESGSTEAGPPTLSVPHTPLPSLPLELLLQASLNHLPATKPRLVTGLTSPHEILRCVFSATSPGPEDEDSVRGFGGADLFDSSWAQRCADYGVALDFSFPPHSSAGGLTDGKGLPAVHNLFDEAYIMDFGRLANALPSAFDLHQSPPSSTATADAISCPCIACSPGSTRGNAHSPPPTIVHSTYERDHPPPHPPTSTEGADSSPQRHFSRAYIHHLLHTHEMSAHTLLAAHNLAVLDAFFAGIRALLASSITTAQDLGADSATGMGTAVVESTSTSGAIDDAIRTFNAVYDEAELAGVLARAEIRWREVEDLRGKGRLRREKEAAAAAASAAAAETGEGTKVVDASGIEAGVDA